MDQAELRKAFSSQIIKHIGVYNLIDTCTACNKGITDNSFQSHCPNMDFNPSMFPDQNYIFGKWINISFEDKVKFFITENKRAVWTAGVTNDYHFGFCDYFADRRSDKTFIMNNFDDESLKDFPSINTWAWSNRNIYPFELFKSIYQNNGCNHEFVNVGFNSIKMVCKFCDKEQS